MYVRTTIYFSINTTLVHGHKTLSRCINTLCIHTDRIDRSSINVTLLLQLSFPLTLPFLTMSLRYHGAALPELYVSCNTRLFQGYYMQDTLIFLYVNLHAIGLMLIWRGCYLVSLVTLIFSR